MATAPVPADEVGDESAPRVPQEAALRSRAWDDITSPPDDGATEEANGARTSIAAADSGHGPTDDTGLEPSANGQPEGDALDDSAAIALKASGDGVDTSPAPEPDTGDRAGLESIDPDDGIDAVNLDAAASSLVPLIDGENPADPRARKLPDPFSAMPVLPVLDMEAGLTAPGHAALSIAPPSPDGIALGDEAEDALLAPAGNASTATPATATPPLTNALDAAVKLAADANAAAEALENLKRLLERQPAAAAAQARAAVPAVVSLPPLLEPAGTADARGEGTLMPVPPPQPLRPAPREHRRLDVHGFLAGFAMSLAVGALLYLLLTTG